jgi:hypothetical protein
MVAEGLFIDTKSRTWIKTAESLGKRLRVIQPNLRAEGVEVIWNRLENERFYRLTYHYVKKLSDLSDLSPDSDFNMISNRQELSDLSSRCGTNCQTCQEPSLKKQQRAAMADRSDRSDSFFPILRGSDVMQLFDEHIKKYGESQRAYILSTERIIDMGGDRGLVEYCATKFHEGHRVYIPPQGEVE